MDLKNKCIYKCFRYSGWVPPTPFSTLWKHRSVHARNELVDHLLAVAPVAATRLVQAVALVNPALLRRGELERPEEVVGLLEVRAHGVNLMDEILNAGDAELAE